MKVIDNRFKSLRVLVPSVVEVIQTRKQNIIIKVISGQYVINSLLFIS